MIKLFSLGLLALTFSGCFMGVSMPHGQRPGVIVGVNLR
jgi:hypothetical protein